MPSSRRWFQPMNPPLRDWKDKVVWIIGASSGIGYAVAQRLAEQGAHVTVSARKPAPLEAFADTYPTGRALPLDVTDVHALRDACAALVARAGHIDLVLFAAGVYTPMRAQQFDLAVMRQHVDVNLLGAYHVVDTVLATLRAQGHGHISFISSVAAWRGLPNALAYGPTKAGLTHLAEVLYMDLARENIGISAVHPGFVETPLTAQNAFSMPALITPDAAADAMLAGWRDGLFDIHFPRRFTWWLKAIRLLPFRWAQALVLRLTGL
jgi:NAD(P)-dependent dehydrogenase (short-subunit alcohol dehydrogenase family)